MARVDKTIEVNVPLGAAYGQWIAFEDYPHFMEGVEQVRCLDGDLLSWVTTVAGERHESQVRIVRRVANKVLAWESQSEDGNNGTVVFRAVGNEKTEVQLHLDYAGANVRDQLGDSRGVVSRRIDSNLKRFKDFVEAKVKTRP